MPMVARVAKPLLTPSRADPMFPRWKPLAALDTSERPLVAPSNFRALSSFSRLARVVAILRSNAALSNSILTMRSSTLAILHLPPNVVDDLVKDRLNSWVDVISPFDPSTSSGAVAVLDDYRNVHAVLNVRVEPAYGKSSILTAELVTPKLSCLSGISWSRTGQSVDSSPAIRTEAVVQVAALQEL